MITVYKPIAAGAQYALAVGTATNVTLTVPEHTGRAWIQAETQNVRITFDGTTATSTTGLLLKTTDTPLLVDHRSVLEGIKMISASASTASSVNILYEAVE